MRVGQNLPRNVIGICCWVKPGEKKEGHMEKRIGVLYMVHLYCWEEGPVSFFLSLFVNVGWEIMGIFMCRVYY
jgi:hypothetical protein